MKCDQIRERMPDLAAGFGELAADDSNHLATCATCAEQLKAMRTTMSLLDEWQVPEPSPYFDTRLQARLREEMAKPQTGWLQWFRQPVLAAALMVAFGLGIGLFFSPARNVRQGDMAAVAAPTGSAASDLQMLDTNHDLYANFDLLDDLSLQQDVTANP